MHPMGRKREEALVLKFLYCLFLGASSDFVMFGFLCLFGVWERARGSPEREENERGTLRRLDGW